MAVNNLRLFTRRRPPEWQHFDLSEMLRTICCQLGQETVHQGLQIQQSFPQALTLYGDPLLIEKAITNLVENAMEAMPGGGTVHVSATSDAAVMDIRIQDGGRGIESHDVEHIFHPFFTTKSGSLGLGLAIVRQVAETHGGIIRVARVNNGGSLISLRLPRRMTSQVA
ncbi:MAG: ATP-binding protein [Planctomycetota bacterium]|nr:ATP-binding protein [Planctomycetota bacterium]